MLFSFLVVLIIVVAFILFMNSLINSWNGQDRYPDEPLYSVRPKELCETMHEWSRGAFLSHKEMEQVKNNPMLLETKKTNFCKTCGYIPTLDRMVKPMFLQEINVQLDASDKLRKKGEAIEKLSEEFYSNIVKNLDATPEELVYLRVGYQAYRSFVDNLPQLMFAEEQEKKKLD